MGGAKAILTNSPIRKKEEIQDIRSFQRSRWEYMVQILSLSLNGLMKFR
jgi:hypothetical protein